MQGITHAEVNSPPAVTWDIKQVVWFWDTRIGQVRERQAYELGLAGQAVRPMGEFWVQWETPSQKEGREQLRNTPVDLLHIRVHMRPLTGTQINTHIYTHRKKKNTWLPSLGHCIPPSKGNSFFFFFNMEDLPFLPWKMGLNTQFYHYPLWPLLSP